MNRRAIAAAFALLGLSPGSTGCSRADVYPVTRDSSPRSGGAGGSDMGGNGAPGGGMAGSAAGRSSMGGSGSGLGGGGTGGGGSGARPSEECPSPALEPGDSMRTIAVDSMSRSYLLHVPAAYDGSKPVPLVLDFHGIGETAASQRAASPYPAALDPEGVVMAFPVGLPGPAGPAWNVGPCCVADVDDVAFARALVADILELACIDRSRVYAVGAVTGGGMAHYLGCHAADLFAAVSPAAFDLLEENVGDCRPARPITVVSFRGTASTRVPYDGGASSLVAGMPLTFLGAQATFEAWAEINRCTGAASPADADGCSAYSGCADGVEVVLCTEQGGREGSGDPAIAWPVLQRHTL